MDRCEKKLKSEGVIDIVRECDSNNADKSSNLFEKQRHPLYVDTVLRCLFGFCDFETLKDCRYVSRKWKKLCDPFFIKNSAFTFINTKDQSIPEWVLQSPPSIRSLFDSFEEEVHFGAFTFERHLITPPVKEMYLDRYKLLMADLEIVKTEADLLTGTKDIIDDLIGPNLQHLKLINNAGRDSDMLVSVEKLKNIPLLTIEQCTLLRSSNDPKIETNYLILKDFVLKRRDDAHELISFPNANLNSFIDIRKLQEVFLSSTEVGPLFHIINFSDLVNIKRLHLFRIQINLDGKIAPKYLTLLHNKYAINGEKVDSFFINEYLRSTEMNDLELNDEEIVIYCGAANTITPDILSLDSNLQISPTPLNYLENPRDNNSSEDEIIEEIGIKKMAIRCFYFRNALDIYVPPLVRHLRIADAICTIPDDEEVVANDDIFIAPRCPIKVEQLLLCGDSLKLLKCFRTCESIVDLSLKGFKGALFDDDDETLLPPNIQRLALWDLQDLEIGTRISLQPKTFNLKVLILSSDVSVDLPCSVMMDAFAKFKPELVVFYSLDADDSDRAAESIEFKDVNTIIKIKQNFQLDNVAFGPVYHDGESEDNFKKSLLFSIIKEKADYYVLEGEGGRTISEPDFLELFTDMEELYIP